MPMRDRDRVVRALLAVLLATVPAGGATLPAPDPVRAAAVVFDTDMDFDDAAALAYLAAQHKAAHIRLRAVTVANNGVGVAGLAGTHARCLLDYFGLRDVPVAEGPTGPPVWPSLSVAAEVVMTTLVPPCPQLPSPLRPRAAELLARVAREEPDLHVLATGPLTNLAWALARDPAVHRTRITVNGGDLSGRADPILDEGLLRDGSQDFNFSCDPAAAQAVLAAGIESLLLVTEGATNDVPMTAGYAARLQSAARTPEARFVSAVANHPVVIAGRETTGAAYWWDPLTAVAADRADVVDQRAAPLTVWQTGHAAGRTVIGGSGRPVRYAAHARQGLFEDHFLTVLNGGG